MPVETPQQGKDGGVGPQTEVDSSNADDIVHEFQMTEAKPDGQDADGGAEESNKSSGSNEAPQDSDLVHARQQPQSAAKDNNLSQAGQGDDGSMSRPATLHVDVDGQAPPNQPAPKEARAASNLKAASTIPEPAISLSASRPNMLPPPRPSMAASSFINPTPTLTPGSTWGPTAASAAAARAEAAEPGRIGDLKRFTLWETKTRFYLVAYNTSQTRFRILKVDRTPPIMTAPPRAQADPDRARETNLAAGTASGQNQTSASADFSSNSSTPVPPSKGGDPKTDTSKGVKVSTNLGPVDCSVRGQRFLSLNDPHICRLNRRMLDAKQVPREGAASSFTTASASNKTATAIGTSKMAAASNPNAEVRSNPTSSASTIRQAESATGSKATGFNTKSSAAEWELNVTSDRVVYSRTQVAELLEMIREGNRATGGLHEIGRFFGIVGFIRFTSTYYMVLISSRSVVALIGGHYVYHCDETVILPVCHASVLASLPGRTKLMEQEEARLLHLFKQVDLSKNFYFSYTYDLTKTLQDNLTSAPGDPLDQASSVSPSTQPLTAWGYNEKFIWNHHLLLPAFAASEHMQPHEDPRNEWVLPLLYGFVDQAKLSVLNRTVYTTLIARRSRHFAGARFLKRGVNEKGHVANDVETEQIVSEALTTPFFAPGRKRFEPRDRHPRPTSGGLRAGPELIRANGLREKPIFQPPTAGAMHYPEASGAKGGEDDDDDYEDFPLDASPRYTSYVMMRGSIPVYWTQDTTNMSPRPPIEVSLVDPYYSAAALHFDELFHRYGTPVIVLNLIKKKEKQEREVKLLRAFGECVTYLNQFLPTSKKIRYIAWDMSQASKDHAQDVIGILEDIAEETLATTHFFHSGPEPSAFRPRATTQSNSNVSGKGPAAPGMRVDGWGHTSKAISGEIAGSAFGEGTRRETILLQEGVARVNCVDCLDRTNAAQFVIGKGAFGHQLHALGLLDNPYLEFDSDAANMLTEMYHDLGDTIAMQYGGSALAHTTDTYRKINQWTSHSRDVLETMKRYYANSFADADKQAAINLFLGVDPMAPDFAPHVFPETITVGKEQEKKAVRAVPFRPHYQKWFDPLHLRPRGSIEARQRRLKEVANADAGFWAEYYRPSLFTDLNRHHAFKMTAVHQYSHLHGGVSHSSGGLGMPHSQSAGALSMYSTQIGGAADLHRHVRSASNSSLSSAQFNAMQAEVLVGYPSPFKPRRGSASDSSAYRRHHEFGRRSIEDARSFTTQTSTTLVNDGRSPVSPRSGQHFPPSPATSATSALPPSKAIIGGVKRWISINKPGGSPRLGSFGHRKSSKRYSIASSEGGNGDRHDTRRGDTAAPNRSSDVASSGALLSATTGSGGFDPHTFNFAGRWQAVGPTVSGSNVAIEAALNKACNPHISEEEESEYAFYTTQFLDEYARPNDADLEDDSNGDVEANGLVKQVRPASAPLMDHHLIDEKDIQIYEEGVAVSDGRPAAVDKLIRYSTIDPILVNHANAISQLSVPVVAASSSIYQPIPMCAGVSTNTPATTMPSAGASGLTISEAKIRAYSSWLSLGQTKLASF